MQNVREGEPLWRSLDDTGVISDLAVEMIKVGESTGALTEMLANVSEFYDEEIEARLARLVAAIEPVILVFMGGVIAVLLYAFYLPLFRLSSVGARSADVSIGRTMVADPNRTLYKNADPTGEAARARRLAEQYGFPFVDLEHFQGDHQLFRDIPLDLMIRYQFLPEHREDGHIAVVVGDPTDVLKLDELELLLGAPLKVKVASPAAIRDKLQKSESTQRVLDEATEGFRMQLVAEDEDGEETLTIDSITQQESSPIIKLVDSIVFNAIQRRASDIHIETRDNEVVVKYRIDGVLYEALEPIDKRHHSTIISRIKIMSELDIAEKRVPQDGRFKLRITGRTIDFRVSIVPTAHGEDSRHPYPRQGVDVQGVQEPPPGHPRLRRGDAGPLPQVHQGAVRDGARHRPDRLGQDHHALRRALRDPVVRKTRSSRSRTRSSISCAASPRSRSTRRRA